MWPNHFVVKKPCFWRWTMLPMRQALRRWSQSLMVAIVISQDVCCSWPHRSFWMKERDRYICWSSIDDTLSCLDQVACLKLQWMIVDCRLRTSAWPLTLPLYVKKRVGNPTGIDFLPPNPTTFVRWVATSTMVADVLTKRMKAIKLDEATSRRWVHSIYEGSP